MSHAESTTIDLYDIVLLLNYERATTDTRFRHAKLREVTKSNFTTFLVLRNLLPAWFSRSNKIGWDFDTKKPPNNRRNERDLPSNMVPVPTPDLLQSLTPKELETYFWQVRCHDGCFTAICLVQEFFDLFPKNTRLHVRLVENNKPKAFDILADNRIILEFELFDPNLLTLSIVAPGGMSYIGGGQDSMPHAVLGLRSEQSQEGDAHDQIPDFDAILDMSSLQFGDVGRRFRGKGLFALESEKDYATRLKTFAKENTFADPRMSLRIHNPLTDQKAWLRDVALHAKTRWEKRHENPFCGYCGAPEAQKRCTACKTTYYCDETHQNGAWSFHKHFCKAAQ